MPKLCVTFQGSKKPNGSRALLLLDLSSSFPPWVAFLAYSAAYGPHVPHKTRPQKVMTHTGRIWASAARMLIVRLSSEEDVTVRVLGARGSGKTSFLYKLYFKHAVGTVRIWPIGLTSRYLHCSSASNRCCPAAWWSFWCRPHRSA